MGDVRSFDVAMRVLRRWHAHTLSRMSENHLYFAVLGDSESAADELMQRDS